MWDQWVCILLALGTEQGQCCSGDNATGEAALVKGKGIYFFISLLVCKKQISPKRGWICLGHRRFQQPCPCLP